MFTTKEAFKEIMCYDWLDFGGRSVGSYPEQRLVIEPNAVTACE